MVIAVLVHLCFFQKEILEAVGAYKREGQVCDRKALVKRRNVMSKKDETRSRKGKKVTYLNSGKRLKKSDLMLQHRRSVCRVIKLGEYEYKPFTVSRVKVSSG